MKLHSNSIKNKAKKKKIANMMVAKIVTENTKRVKAKSKPQGWAIYICETEFHDQMQ